MIHYHGTPITPLSVLRTLAGKHFCVSFAAPQDVKTCHEIGQSVMLDNGAFSFWRSGRPVDWDGYYAWAEQWLAYHTTWAVIPDTIDGTSAENDDLIDSWVVRFGTFRQAAPVWHLHESLQRLDILTRKFDRVCIGSSGEYSTPRSPNWHRRMIEAFNGLGEGKPRAWLHMLRGMALSGYPYPFASVDSTDVARNHNRSGNAKRKAEIWDSIQCPAVWVRQAEQATLSLDPIRGPSDNEELQHNRRVMAGRAIKET